MTPIRPGLCSVTFRQLEPAAIVDLAAEAGIAGIEWGADVHVPLGAVGRAADVAARSAEHGLACPSYGTYLGVREPITSRDDVTSACETAAALGSTNLRVWTPLGTAPGATASDRDTIATGIRLAAEVAAEHAMTIGIEFHHGTLTETAASALDVFRAVDMANVFSYWQPNFWVEQPAATEAQLAELHAMRPWLSHLHTFWWLARGERRPLADGAGMWPTAFGETTSIANGWTADRYAFMEFVVDDDPDHFRADAATLLSWLAAT